MPFRRTVENDGLIARSGPFAWTAGKRRREAVPPHQPPAVPTLIDTPRLTSRSASSPHDAADDADVTAKPKSRRPTKKVDIRIDAMVDELSRCDKGGALDICCRELRDDMNATRAKLREYDEKLKELIRQHASIECGQHETRIKATMVRTTQQARRKSGAAVAEIDRPPDPSADSPHDGAAAPSDAVSSKKSSSKKPSSSKKKKQSESEHKKKKSEKSHKKSTAMSSFVTTNKASRRTKANGDDRGGFVKRVLARFANL
jgi:hypothetical protein